MKTPFKGWPPLWYKINVFWQFFGKVTALKLTILSCRDFPCVNTFMRRYHRSLPSNIWKDVSILWLASKRHTFKKWQKSNLSIFKSVPIVMNTFYCHKIHWTMLIETCSAYFNVYTLILLLLTNICHFENLPFSGICKNSKKIAIFFPNILVHQKFKLLHIRKINTSN